MINVIVGGWILGPDGRALMITGPKFHNRWVIAGGHLEVGETLEQALKREIREETGLDVVVKATLGVQEAVYDPEFIPGEHCLLVDMLCKAKSTKVSSSEEAQKLAWMSLAELAQANCGNYTHKGLQEYRSRLIEAGLR